MFAIKFLNSPQDRDEFTVAHIADISGNKIRNVLSIAPRILESCTPMDWNHLPRRANRNAENCLMRTWFKKRANEPTAEFFLRFMFINSETSPEVQNRLQRELWQPRQWLGNFHG